MKVKLSSYSIWVYPEECNVTDVICVCVCWAIRPSLPVGVVMTINRPLHCHQDDDIDEKG